MPPNPPAAAAGSVATSKEPLNDLAINWRDSWVERDDWQRARKTADPGLAMTVVLNALKDAAKLGLSLRTFIEYDWENNAPVTVNRVVRPLLRDCFPADDSHQYTLAMNRLIKDSRVRTNFSYEQNDAGMPDLLYVIKENKYYLRKANGPCLPISKEHLKTMCWQHGINTEAGHGAQSHCDSYLLWLALNRAVADISEVAMEADSDPEKCCTAFEILTKPEKPESVLLGNRLLTRGNAMVISASTGIGKSTLGAQAAVAMTSHRTFCGIKTGGELSVLYVQAENDDLDLKEMLAGVCAEQRFSEAEQKEVLQRIIIYNENAVSGMDFLALLRRLCREHKPDVILIDPLNSYVGDDLREQTAVARFCRNGLGAILREHNCGLIVLHHTNKPRAGDKPADRAEGYDLAYNYSGGADLANWARAMITLQSIGGDVFKFTITKRWKRAGMPDNYGRPNARVAYLKHSKDRLCWKLATPDEIEQAEIGGVDDEDIVVRLPQDGAVGNPDLRSILTRLRIPKNCQADRIDQLVASGRLYLWKRPGSGAAKYYGRVAQPPNYDWEDYDVRHRVDDLVREVKDD